MSLRDIYDRAFFREYGAANPDYAAGCAIVAAELHRRFRPATAVDWGCGAGLHARALADRGTAVVAVDGVLADGDLRAADVDIAVVDLRRALPAGAVPARYDLSLCIDVLEHLDAADAGTALDHITRGAAVVVLSCAPPHQGGHDHRNEQPRRYWIAAMAARGWHYDRSETGALERALSAHARCIPHSWMYHNLCVYRPHPTPGRRLAKRLRKLARHSRAAAGKPLR